MNGDAAELETQAGPDLRLLLGRGVKRSFPWVVLLVALGAGVGLALGLVQPNRYASEAKLLLRIGAREQVTSESLVDFDTRQHVPAPTMADELQMLSDVAIFERVARELGPRTILEPADPTRSDRPSTPAPVRWMHGLQAALFRRLAADEQEASSPDEELRAATKVLREDSEVDNVPPGSSVIVVSHVATSPETARAIVQALTDAFIERHRDEFSIQAVLERNRGKLAQAKEARDAAATAFVEHVNQSGITELEAQVPRLQVEITALENEQFETRVRREEIARLRTALSNRLQGLPAVIELQRPAVMIPNEEYETQLALKRNLLAQRQELLVESRPSEERRRREREIESQIAKVDEKLRSTPRAVAQGAELTENLGRSAMETRVAEIEVEDESLAVKAELVDARLEAKRAEMGALQRSLLGATMKRSDLQAARQAEESRYDHLVARFSALEALSSIDMNEDANLRVLQAPTYEEEKVGPERGSLLLKGLLAGLFAALALAVLRESFERRLRHPELFEQARGVPVLGIVPEVSSLRRMRARVVARRN